ncbi:MAG: cupin domain-containing protein [Thioalkalivibrionaceae bacterium]
MNAHQYDSLAVEPRSVMNRASDERDSPDSAVLSLASRVAGESRAGDDDQAVLDYADCEWLLDLASKAADDNCAMDGESTRGQLLRGTPVPLPGDRHGTTADSIWKRIEARRNSERVKSDQIGRAASPATGKAVVAERESDRMRNVTTKDVSDNAAAAGLVGAGGAAQPPGRSTSRDEETDGRSAEAGPSRRRISTVSMTRRAHEGQWWSVRDGIRIKSLHVDKRSGSRSFLMSIAAGATYPAHPHQHDEECIVLEGDVRIGDERLVAGDYHLAPAGSVHTELSSEHGALLFLRAGLEDTTPARGEQLGIVWRTLRDRFRAR